MEFKITHLSANHFINASVTIHKGVIKKDSLLVLENPETKIAVFLLSVYQHFGFNYPRFYKMDNLSKMGWLASELLLFSSFKKENYNNEDIGVILANANSSLDNDIRYFNSIKDFPSPSLFVYTLPNIVIGEIAIRNHFKGEHAFFVQEKFDAGFMHQQVDYLLSKQLLRACVCGWVDVLEEDYKTALFLVEKQRKNDQAVLFSAKNIESIFNNS